MRSPSRKFIPSLHLLRGICAVSVALYHYLAWGHQFVISSMGTFGVYTFFILSAVVLLHTHAEEFHDVISRERLLKFYVLRFARVIPLLAAVTLFGMVFVHFQQGASFDYMWKKSFLTASGLFALHMPGILSTTTGAWSLGIEIVFYLLFPVLALLCSVMSTRAIASWVVLLLLAQYALLKSLPESSAPEFWGQYIMPLTFAPFFGVGFLIYRSHRINSHLDLGLSLVCLSLVFGFSLISRGDVLAAGFTYLLLTGLAGGAVYFAWSAKLPALLLPLAMFLGNISYSLYLTHWIAFEFAKKSGVPAIFPVVAISIAYLCWKFIERPARRFLTPPPTETASPTAAGLSQSK
ncbi:acyltransferase family protein [Rhizobium leguminosarum]|nr:acyltransferase [Rhizobium leguminosarum]